MFELLVFGLAHPLQCGAASCTQGSVAAYREEIRSQCVKHSIQRIAEEMCEDGRTFHGVATTVAFELAAELELAHQDLDLSHAERAALSCNDSPLLTSIMSCPQPDGGARFREALGIVTDEVRERVWVMRLLVEKTWPVLFLCGADHVQPVRRLWEGLGLPAAVVHRDYVP